MLCDGTVARLWSLPRIALIVKGNLELPRYNDSGFPEGFKFRLKLSLFPSIPFW